MKTFVTVTALAVLTALPAVAQQTPPSCMPTPQMYQQMIERYGESRSAVGINSDGAMIEFWGNDDVGSWTVIGTGPGGISCILSYGDGFERFEARPNV